MRKVIVMLKFDISMITYYKKMGLKAEFLLVCFTCLKKLPIEKLYTNE